MAYRSVRAYANFQAHPDNRANTGLPTLAAHDKAMHAIQAVNPGQCGFGIGVLHVPEQGAPALPA